MSTTSPIVSNPKFKAGRRAQEKTEARRHRGVAGDYEADRTATGVVAPMNDNPIKNMIRSIVVDILLGLVSASRLLRINLLSTSTADFMFEAMLAPMLKSRGVPFSMTGVELAPSEFHRAIRNKPDDCRMVKGDILDVPGRKFVFNTANLCVAADKTKVACVDYNVAWADLCLVPTNKLVDDFVAFCRAFAVSAATKLQGSAVFLGFYGCGGFPTAMPWRRLTGFSGVCTPEAANADFIRIVKGRLSALGVEFNVLCNLDYLGGNGTHISLVGLGFGTCATGTDACFKHEIWAPEGQSKQYFKASHAVEEFRRDWNKANRKYSVMA